MHFVSEDDVLFQGHIHHLQRQSKNDNNYPFNIFPIDRLSRSFDYAFNVSFSLNFSDFSHVAGTSHPSDPIGVIWLCHK